MNTDQTPPSTRHGRNVRTEAVLRQAVEYRFRPVLDDIDAQNILFEWDALRKAARPSPFGDTLDWIPIDKAPKPKGGPLAVILLGFEDSGEGGWPTCQGYWNHQLDDWVVASPFNPYYMLLSAMTDYKPTHYLPLPKAPITKHKV